MITSTLISGATLPNHIVYCFELSLGVDKLQSEQSVWERKEASGELHPGVNRAAFTVIGKKLYLFGGNGDEDGAVGAIGGASTNALSTLCPDGHFERLHPKGRTPTPSSVSRSWNYNGKMIVLNCCVKSEKGPSYRRTIELFQYDPAVNELSIVETTGSRPSPRVKFAGTILGDQIFIYGGVFSQGILDGLFVLSMISHDYVRVDEN